MGTFERYLSLWVAIAIAVGVVAGNAYPTPFTVIADLEFAHVNLVIAALIWLMIYPMMLHIDFASLRNVGKRPRGLALTLVVNWLIKPFSMAAIATLFFDYLFADLVDPQTASEYIAGMILLGVAPCTAMVFVWSQLTDGDPAYTLVQVSLNDIVMVLLFAPLCALLLGLNAIVIPWQTLLLSSALYVLLPLLAGLATRRALSEASLQRLTRQLKPWSMAGLLATVALLFGFQADVIISRPLNIALIALPLILQTYGIFALAYFAAWRMGLPHNIAAPASMIATSNFFELAVAVAISLFGLHSAAALATVVGVLVEVPVMLSLVAFANRSRTAFPLYTS
ncbi:ACR3 family arsenite efflux transporter [Spongiibacter sp.]|uniref:ACR3 family arsenite efflux transporter n=1 Tax=Spongiibacter sp. TaxID=2024860 RepID=UPI00356742B5